MQWLTNGDIAELTDWRRALHRAPELSGEEAATAARVVEALRATHPAQVLTGLGGHGVAAVYPGAAPGPTVLIRCELDALPIEETGAPPYRSEMPGKAHLCGHDGHMAILAGVARALGRLRPARGRAVLLFQPSEEDGAGAARIIADARWPDIAPDVALACHNMPGLALGTALLAEGVVNCASRGMTVGLTGRTAHASEPDKGVSPMPALAALMPALAALSRPADGPGFRLVTVTHARMGAPAFGIAPGEATLLATLRTLHDNGMEALAAEAVALVESAAASAGLRVEIGWQDVFAHCENTPAATALLARALDAAGIPHAVGGLPMRASEDFGRFRAAGADAAMVFLGAGRDHPPLHAPDYDFPDALIPLGVQVFVGAIRELLGP